MQEEIIKDKAGKVWTIRGNIRTKTKKKQNGTRAKTTAVRLEQKAWKDHLPYCLD